MSQQFNTADDLVRATMPPEIQDQYFALKAERLARPVSEWATECAMAIDYADQKMNGIECPTVNEMFVRMAEVHIAAMLDEFSQSLVNISPKSE